MKTSGGWAPYSTCFSHLGVCPRNPSVSVYQLALLWGLEFSFSEIFWKLFQHICPFMMDDIWGHLTTLTVCSPVFDQKWPEPCASPSLFTRSHLKWLFFVSLDEKSPQRGMICWCGRGDTKIAEIPKASKSMSSKTVLSRGKKHLNRCIAWNGEYFEGVKFNYVRKIYIFINKLCFGGPPFMSHKAVAKLNMLMHA